jgi:hypothetical protein
MANSVYPLASREIAQKRRALAPDIEAAFDAFSQRVFADGRRGSQHGATPMVRA